MKRFLCLWICLALVFVPVFSGCGASSAPESQETASVLPDAPAETPAASDKTEVNIHYPEPLPHEGTTEQETISVTPEVTPTPEPVTEEPVEEPSHSEPAPSILQEQTVALVSSFDGEWSVYFERTDTGESFVINDYPMVSASLIKLYVYGTAMEQIENGILPDGVYEDALWNMITCSDNDSCNILIDAVGGFDAVNDFIVRNGFSSTQLNRKMLDFNGLENYTSTADCGHLILQALQGTLISEHASGYLQELMKSQSVTWKIPAGVPEGIITGNKTGELTGVENDAAFVFSPACTYILCVMSSGVDSGTAIANINTLSSTVYTLLNQDLEGDET